MELALAHRGAGFTDPGLFLQTSGFSVHHRRVLSMCAVAGAVVRSRRHSNKQNGLNCEIEAHSNSRHVWNMRVTCIAFFKHSETLYAFLWCCGAGDGPLTCRQVPFHRVIPHTAVCVPKCKYLRSKFKKQRQLYQFSAHSPKTVYMSIAPQVCS